MRWLWEERFSWAELLIILALAYVGRLVGAVWGVEGLLVFLLAFGLFLILVLLRRQRWRDKHRDHL